MEAPSPFSHSDAIVDGLADDLGRARPFTRWRRVRRHPFPGGFASCMRQNTGALEIRGREAAGSPHMCSTHSQPTEQRAAQFLLPTTLPPRSHRHRHRLPCPLAGRFPSGKEGPLSSIFLYQPSEAGFRLELVYKTREIFMAACRMDSELDIFDYLESKIPDASGLNWVPGLLERFPDPLPSLFNPHILFAHHPRLAPG